MEQYQAQVERHLLKTEEKTLKQIQTDYKEALEQVKKRIRELTEEYEQNPELVSKVYQRKYQELLRQNLEKTLSGLAGKNFEHTKSYLEQSYQDAYIGSNYATVQQGYSIFLPYDDKKMMEAIYNSPSGFKISAANYDGNIDELRTKMQSTLSRGLASGMSYQSIAIQAASQMHMSFNDAKRIVATEGHRVQNEAKMDCMREARAAGADIVKEWCAVLDNKTRTRHSVLDGQVRELDEPFTALGADVMYPGGFGIASEDINCRCCLLQRSRKALSVGRRRQLESYASFRKNYNKTMGGSIKINTIIREERRVFVNPNRNYAINIDVYSNEVNTGLSKAALDLAMKGSEDGYEHMYLVDLATGELKHYETNHEAHSVGYKFWKVIQENPDRQYAFVHNHSYVSSLSATDLLTVARNENIPLVVAVQNDGTIYYARRTREAVSGFIEDDYYEKELEELNILSRSGKISPIERTNKREDILIKCLIRDFFDGMEMINSE